MVTCRLPCQCLLPTSPPPSSQLPATFFNQASKLATDLQSTFEKFLSEFHLVNIFLLFKGFKPHPAGHLFAQFVLLVKTNLSHSVKNSGLVSEF